MTTKQIKKTATDATTEVVNEQSSDRLDMEQITKKWQLAFHKIQEIDNYSNKKDGKGIGSTTMLQWNRLNPFLQNQRLKQLYTNPKVFAKTDIGQFLQNPGNHESELRGVSWAQSSSQQIYYNVLRHACDIPLYKYYKIPEYGDDVHYNKPEFKAEDNFVEEWLDMFNIPNTFKTIALQVKREGKQSYLLRNKFEGTGNNKRPVFTTLQKMPTEWIKITGISQLGYTISFNMMYFLNIANDPARFGDFIEKAWADMVDTGVVAKAKIPVKTYGKGKTKRVEYIESDEYELNVAKAKDYKFQYEGKSYTSIIESSTNEKNAYLFWLQMPYDICYTFGSDNSHPWVAPDTMGLLMKLQELNDYQILAGLISSTPLTAVLTGEIESIAQPRAGKNESIYSPEVLQGMQQLFNSVTSTNIECWLFPAKNIKLQQLSSDVNSSEIIKTATENFISSAGEGGLTSTTEKPNIGQVTVAKQLAAEQQRYLTLQFEQVMNFIVQNKLGLKYRWKIKIWGDAFGIDNDRKFLKELVSNGALMFLPKLLSAEDISVRDTKAIVDYIKELDFYKDLATFSMIKQSDLGAKASLEESVVAKKTKTGKVGKPAIDDANVENDATAASKEAGTNTRDNRNQVK